MILYDEKNLNHFTGILSDENCFFSLAEETDEDVEKSVF